MGLRPSLKKFGGLGLGIKHEYLRIEIQNASIFLGIQNIGLEIKNDLCLLLLQNQ